jgi:exo-beta-1,3-glucanase (GH17 family)
MDRRIFEQLNIPRGRAICYSGFRQGQEPGGIYPSYQEIREDLLLLNPHWQYLRLFDCDQHAETVLDVIVKEQLDFRVMLGAYIGAEMNNFNCPWNGGVYAEHQLAENMTGNMKKITRLIELANQHPEIVFAVSVGNEACAEWTDHYVPEEKILQFVHLVKSAVKQPVTYCENYVPWIMKLEKVAEAVDFISIHTYPVWEYRHIGESMDHTRNNYEAVAGKYPGKPVVITEAGWATRSNGRGINPENVNEDYQKIYFDNLMAWTAEEEILAFFFEAFDESWKGSPEPSEPEKHWGLFHIDRTPKKAIQQIILTEKKVY